MDGQETIASAPDEPVSDIAAVEPVGDVDLISIIRKILVDAELGILKAVSVTFANTNGNIGTTYHLPPDANLHGLSFALRAMDQNVFNMLANSPSK